MKIFMDCEFIAGFNKPFMQKRRHHIDLISVGLVDENSREYYALSKDFNPSDADEWVRENVFKSLVNDYVKTFNGDERNRVLSLLSGKTIVGQMNVVQNAIGKSDKVIAAEIKNFVYGPAIAEGDGLSGADADIDAWLKENKIAFYTFYGSYDWVLFCSLFGRMVDLPAGFPMFTHDLKQMMEEQNLSKEWKQRVCPDPEGEHNALVDARWNKLLFHAIEAAKRDGTGH